MRQWEALREKVMHPRGDGAINVAKPQDPCPRCKGKMFEDKTTEDRACFNCGHVTYAHPAPLPEPGEPMRRRRATHAGWSLG